MSYASVCKQGCLYPEKPQIFAFAPCGMFFAHLSSLLLNNSVSSSPVVLSFILLLKSGLDENIVVVVDHKVSKH